MINVKVFQVFTSEMILLSKFNVIIISHVFIKKFILYSNHFKHIGLFISIFIAIILLHIYAVRTFFSQIHVRIACLFFYYVALKKAGKHMEDSMVASYVALFLGCLVKDNTVC